MSNIDFDFCLNANFFFLQLIDILKGYIDMEVMMQKPNAGGERELRRHYKVLQL